MPNLDELRESLQRDPRSVRSRQLMDAFTWDALSLLLAPNRDLWPEKEVAISAIAHEILSSMPKNDDTWRLWYAGQIQGAVRLTRAHMARQIALSTIAMVRSRKHVPSILEVLYKEDSNLSDLAEKVGLDLSQLSREIREMEQHGLIVTSKQGRERWVRITVEGVGTLMQVRTVTHMEKKRPGNTPSGNSYTGDETTTRRDGDSPEVSIAVSETQRSIFEQSETIMNFHAKNNPHSIRTYVECLSMPMSEDVEENSEDMEQVSEFA